MPSPWIEDDSDAQAPAPVQPSEGASLSAPVAWQPDDPSLVRNGVAPYDAQAATQSLYPNARITSWMRSADDPLTQANPNSWHTTPNAVDVAPIPGMTYQQFIQGYKDKGMGIVESRDEATHPLPWTTGPNWHVVLSAPQAQAASPWQEVPQAQAAPATPAAPVVADPSHPAGAADTLATYGNTGVHDNTQTAADAAINGFTAPTGQAVSPVTSDRLAQAQRDVVQASTLDPQTAIASLRQKYPDVFSSTSDTDLGSALDYYRKGNRGAIDFQAGQKAPTSIAPTENTPVESMLGRDKNAFQLAAQEGFGGDLSEEATKLLNIGRPKGMSDADWNAAVTQARQNDIDRKAALEDHQVSLTNPIDNVVDKIGQFAAGAAGGANPAYAVSGGESALARAMTAFGANAGSDALEQVYHGRPFNPVEATEAGLLPGALHGLGEGISAFRARGVTPEAEAPVAPPGQLHIDPIQDNDYIGGKHVVTLRDDQGNVTAQGNVAVDKYGNPGPVTLWDPRTNEKVSTSTGEDQYIREQTTAMRNRTGQNEVTQDNTDPKIQNLQAAVDSAKAGWKNAPDITVVSSHDQLPAGLRDQIELAGDKSNPLGAYYNGKVYLMGHNLESPSEGTAVLFHEALGHAGLSDVFRDRLDGVLTDAYNRNASLKADTDAFKKTPDFAAYADDTNPHARAVEEVLARRSENGPVQYGLSDRLKTLFQQTARKIGLTDNMSDSEVTQILHQAHDRVINGADYAPDANGTRFMFRGNRAQGEDTGQPWFRGPDNLPRQEIPDQNATVNEDAFQHGHAKLSDVLDHPELYKQYPDAKNIDVYRSDRYAPDQAMYSPRQKTMIVPSETGQLRNLLLHEAQHFVQEKEDFARGTTPDQALKHADDDYLNARKQRALDIADKRMEEYAPHTYEYHAARLNKSLVQDGSTEAIRTALSWDKNSREAAYYHHVGEAEANDVEARSNMSDEERRAFPPELDSPKEPGDIVYHGDLENASEGARFATRSGRIANMNLDNVRTTDDMKELLNHYAEGYSRLDPSQTHEQTQEAADDLISQGFSPKEIRKMSSVDAPHLLAARQVMAQAAQDLVVHSRNFMAAEDQTPEMIRNLGLKQSEFNATVNRVNNIVRDIGQALDSMKIAVGPKLSEGDAAKYAQKALVVSEEQFKDPAFVKQLAKLSVQFADNPAALAQIARDSGKKDTSFMSKYWYNMILSNPYTHARYWTGNGVNLGVDLASYFGAAALSVPGRMLGREGVHFREAAARAYGISNALGAAFKDSGRSLSALAGDTSTNGRPGNALPTHILESMEERMGDIVRAGEYHGAAMRQAIDESQKNGASWKETVDRGLELGRNPNRKIIMAAEKGVDRLLYKDAVSPVTNIPESWRNSPNRPGVQGKGDAVLKELSRFVIPFLQRPDGIVRTALRYSPLGVLDRYNIEGFLKGGPDAAVSATRIAMGSYLSYWAASKVAQGRLDGDGPQDYKQHADWLAEGHVPNSIQLDDGTRVPIKGISPFADSVLGIANAYQAYNDTKKSDLVGKSTAAALAVGQTLAGDNWVGSVSPIVEAMDSHSSASGIGGNIKNWAANIASSLVVPAGVRAVNQGIDPLQRDTKTDGSFQDMVSARTQAGIPGQSEQMPSKLDVLGQPMASRGGLLPTVKGVTDPVRVAMANLQQPGKALIGPVPTTIISEDDNGDPQTVKLSPSQIREYQRVSGNAIYQEMSKQVASPQWKTMSDEDKRQAFHDAVKDARSDARDSLFPDLEDGIATAPKTPATTGSPWVEIK